MDFLRRKDGGMFWGFLCVLLFVLVGLADGNLLLMGRNVTRSFQDIEANFGPAITGSGEKGVLFMAEPLDACTSLTNEVADSLIPPFALIVRGGCTFEDKVRSAQAAGFKAAVVYNDEYSDTLVAMAGISEGINIPSVFVSGTSGEILKKYAGCADLNLWIIPTFENSAWSIMAISFISLLAMSVVLATCFFVRRQRVRRERPRASQVRAFHGMSSQLVKAMPSLIFTSVLGDNSTSSACCICLEDYTVGEKLRLLPCHHKFHAVCVDSWLTTWRTFCPVCKQDAKTGIRNPTASESTPLLTPVSVSPPATVVLPSSDAFLAATPVVPIVPLFSRTPLASLTNSFSSRHFVETHRHSPINRSHIDRLNALSHKAHTFHFGSPHSLGFPLHLPPRYPSQYIPSSNNASHNYLVGSPSRQTYLQDCESEDNLSALGSTQSLPGC